MLRGVNGFANDFAEALRNLNVEQRALIVQSLNDFGLLVGVGRNELIDAAEEGNLVELNHILMQKEINPASYNNRALRVAAMRGHNNIVDRLIWLPTVQTDASFMALKNRYPIIQEAYVKKYAMLQALALKETGNENFFQWLPDEMLQELAQLLDQTSGPNEDEWEKIAFQQEKYVNQFQFEVQFKAQFKNEIQDGSEMEIDAQETRKRKRSHE